MTTSADRPVTSDPPGDSGAQCSGRHTDQGGGGRRGAPRGAGPAGTGAGRVGHGRHHPGLFISFEGADGVGKTTQLTLLADALTAAGVEVVVTREPGGTELGSDVRRLLLHGGHVDPRAEALLYAADRAHHVATLVRPALECGAVVLTDRYLDSSVAYQGAARSLGPHELRDLSLWATSGLLPDLTVLLDADPDLASSRRQDRGEADRMEREGAEFRAALREQFLALAASEPERFTVVNAARGVDEVAEDVATVVWGLLSSSGRASGDGAA